ncbi:hypothetical protein L596_009974 [Steinernema carpocapsae]|uniref:Histidine phosphatase family protein n=1 Tax=Steinernema carpocapsae TaxID=34508 RepID=A0A4U5PHQ2_STECR|nr:hypothetical protein L596_009974 [Steinernema carpocapsae]
MSGVLRDSSEASRTVWIVRHGEREDHVDQEWHLRAPRGAVDDPELRRRLFAVSHLFGCLRRSRRKNGVWIAVLKSRETLSKHQS